MGGWRDSEGTTASGVTMAEQVGVGDRLRQLRKLRGLTQHQLAARAHFSLSLVKKVEQGSLPPSAAFVAGAAQALGIRPSHLYGTDEREIVEQPAGELANLGALRTALDAYDDPAPEGTSLSLRTVIDRLGAAAHNVYGLRYAMAAHELPNLLHQLYVLAEQPGHSGQWARAALHDAYRMTATVAGRFRQADLAAVASERHIRLAPETGDPLRIAISAHHRSSGHLQHGEYASGLRVITRAREHVDTRPAGRALTVQLNLRAAVLAARAGDRQQADGFLDEARALAKQFRPPETPYFNIDASAMNIAVHWCAVPVEYYDGTEAVGRAAQVRVVDPRRPERVGHHHIDMARAWALHGDRAEALEQLNLARRVAPHNTRHHPAVRETVRALANADRRTTNSLARFARWAGIQV